MSALASYAMAPDQERAHRLRQAMKRADVAPSSASDRWGWNVNTLRSNMNGHMGFSHKRATIYAARLKVRPDWLYSGDGEMTDTSLRSRRPVIEVPVISWVSAGHLAETGQVEDVEELERLAVSGLPPADYFILNVQGDSMDRVSPDGSRIIVRHDRSRPVPGGFYVFGSGGETTYKRFYDEPIRFEPYSTNPMNRTIYPREGWEVVGQVVRSFIDLNGGK